MHLQNAAVGKAARDRLLHLGHVCTAALGKQQRLSHCTNGDAHDHLVGQFGELATAVRAHQRGAAKVGKHVLRAFKISRLAANHDDQLAVYGAHHTA